MGAFFGFGGMAVAVGFLVYLIYSIIKKKPTKTAYIGLAAGVVLFVIGLAITPSTKEGSQEATATQATTTTAATTAQSTAAQTTTQATTKATTGQVNALKSAKAYLGTAAFSRTGLMKQLEFEGYSTDEATYAVDNCGADWKQQAVKSAKQYLDLSSFSRKSLIAQLEFEGFTREQAVYGAEQNGY